MMVAVELTLGRSPFPKPSHPAKSHFKGSNYEHKLLKFPLFCVCSCFANLPVLFRSRPMQIFLLRTQELTLIDQDGAFHRFAMLSHDCSFPINRYQDCHCTTTSSRRLTKGQSFPGLLAAFVMMIIQGACCFAVAFGLFLHHPPMANLILDDSHSDTFTIDGGTWSAVTAARFFGGGSIWPAFASTENGDTGSYGSLNVNFEGTQISFFGNTPSAKASQNVFVSIDGRAPHNTSYDDASPPTAVQWYQSPVLSEGKHTINITHIAGTSLDYMVIAAGQSTPLTGQTLIVDDNDPAITYDGNWTRNVGRFTLQDDPHESMPHGNATHQSSSQGSKATFLFSGQSVAVYSVFNYSRLGTVTVTYTIDDSVSQTKTHSVTPATAEFRAGVLSRANVLLFSSDIAAGDHRLTILVEASVDQTPLVLDYILYTPSFATLASKPNLNPLSSSTSLRAGLTISSTGTSTDIAAGSTSGVNPNAPKAAANKGPLVGAIVGGVVALALLLMLLFCRKRPFKRILSSSTPPSPQFSRRAGPPSVEPFTSIVPSTAATYGDSSHHKPGTSTSSTSPDTPIATATHYNSNRTVTGSDAASMGLLETPRPGTSQHKSSPSFSTSALTPLRPEYVQQERDAEGARDVVVGDGGTGRGVLRTRMQRLQVLVMELNREMEEGGEEGVRVAELKGRIAELTREGEGRGAEVGRSRDRQSVATTTVPPPYEPRGE